MQWFATPQYGDIWNTYQGDEYVQYTDMIRLRKGALRDGSILPEDIE